MKRPHEDTLNETGGNEIKSETLAQTGMKRLIHFIWAGGNLNMPSSSTDTVNQWAEANPSFDIIIWVDAWEAAQKVFDPRKLGKMLIYYQNQFKSAGIEVLLNELPADYPRKVKAPLIIRDITQHKMVNEYVRYEIDKVLPNFG